MNLKVTKNQWPGHEVKLTGFLNIGFKKLLFVLEKPTIGAKP